MENKTKILIVDDEVEFVQAMSFWLKSKGYTVISALDGENAVTLIKNESPDLAFLDLNMPVMDGIQTLKQIRKFNQKLPVIVISAYVDDKRIIEARNYGLSGVFYKDKDFQESLPLLEAALRTHKGLKK